MIYLSKNGIFTEENNALAKLLPPVFEANGEPHTFAVCEDKSYRLGAMIANDDVTYVDSGLFKVKRTVKNSGRTRRMGKFFVLVDDLFLYKKSTIPCVMFDENKLSGGKEPHGFSYNNKTWLFSYDRVSIPSCTVSENADHVCALFASDANADSLRSSCGFKKNEDGTLQHIIGYPVTEAPLSYVDHDVLGPRYDEYITLAPGDEFSTEFYIFLGEPKWENFGVASVIECAEKLFKFKHSPALSVKEVREAAIKQSEFLLCDYNGAKMFRNAMRNDPNSDKIYMPYTVFEAGWSGQSFMQARHYIDEYIRNGNKYYLDTALSCLDAWMESQLESGLFPINYRRHVTKEYLPCDVCNFAWAAAEAVKAYKKLNSIGIERDRYLEFARRICDFFVANYDSRTGFGLKWTVYGEKVADGGSIGGFMIMAMLEIYKATNDKKYLECAITAMELYGKRDIENFSFTAGAIDCACIDKETAYPFIRAALDLYEITGEEKYLICAEKSAFYFQSWMFVYDALYDNDSDFSRLGYYTSGGTAVSTQHPAIDPWGAIAIPEYIRLAKITGDERWKIRARSLWCNCILCITPAGGRVLHGHFRPEGIQSEAFFQTRWTRYRNSCEERGHLNDMYVGWPSAFRLDTIVRIEEELGNDFKVIEKEG